MTSAIRVLCYAAFCAIAVAILGCGQRVTEQRRTTTTTAAGPRATVPCFDSEPRNQVGADDVLCMTDSEGNVYLLTKHGPKRIK